MGALRLGEVMAYGLWYCRNDVGLSSLFVAQPPLLQGLVTAGTPPSQGHKALLIHLKRSDSDES